MRRRLVAIVAVLLVAGCAPVASPIGGQDRVCRWVRESVKNGSLPVALAWAWYEHCAPFEVPQ